MSAVMPPHARDFVARIVSQTGDPYVFGAEASVNDPNPRAFDCSEATEWGANGLGVRPPMPDGSWIQARHCRAHGTLIPVADAFGIAGALLFRFSGDPFGAGRPGDAHVAVSMGDRKATVEARGRAFGLGVFGAVTARRWTHAGLVPGLDYASRPPVVRARPTRVVRRVLVPGGRPHRPSGNRRPLWKVYDDGSVHALHGAPFFGALPHGEGGLGVRVTNIVDLVPYLNRRGRPDGYWIVGADGGVFACGDAPYPGSLPGLGLKPARPITEAELIDADPVTLTLVAADDGTFDLRRKAA